MCMLLKLQYAKLDVSRLFCSKVIEGKPLGGGSRAPLVKEGLSTAQALSTSKTKVSSPDSLLFLTSWKILNKSR